MSHLFVCDPLNLCVFCTDPETPESFTLSLHRRSSDLGHCEYAEGRRGRFEWPLLLSRGPRQNAHAGGSICPPPTLSDASSVASTTLHAPFTILSSPPTRQTAGTATHFIGGKHSLGSRIP